MGAKNRFEQGGGNFVMLRVGGIDLERDRARAHGGQVIIKPARPLARPGALGGQPLPEQLPDSHTDDTVREPAPLGKFENQAHGEGLRGLVRVTCTSPMVRSRNPPSE